MHTSFFILFHTTGFNYYFITLKPQPSPVSLNPRKSGKIPWYQDPGRGLIFARKSWFSCEFPLIPLGMLVSR